MITPEEILDKHLPTVKYANYSAHEIECIYAAMEEYAHSFSLQQAGEIWDAAWLRCLFEDDRTKAKGVPDKATYLASLPVDGGSDEWMPVESAPKDGTRVLLCADDKEIMASAYWDDGFRQWLMRIEQTSSNAITGRSIEFKAIAWQPLPSPPVNKIK